MRNYVCAAFLIIFCISCKKEIVITLTKEVHTETPKEEVEKDGECGLWTIGEFVTDEHGSRHEVMIGLSAEYPEEMVPYPTVILRDDKGNKVGWGGTYGIWRGSNYPIWIHVDNDSLLKESSSWRMELVQLNSEDSILCAREFHKIFE